MKNERIKQLAIVQENSAPAFETKLNDKLMELKDNSPEVTFAVNDTLCAYISYYITQPIEVEPITSSGCVFVCADCPHFEPMRKADGSIDGRAKVGGCRFAEYGRTRTTSTACELLYTQIQNGEVRLCLSDSE